MEYIFQVKTENNCQLRLLHEKNFFTIEGKMILSPSFPSLIFNTVSTRAVYIQHSNTILITIQPVSLLSQDFPLLPPPASALHSLCPRPPPHIQVSLLSSCFFVLGPLPTLGGTQELLPLGSVLRNRS